MLSRKKPRDIFTGVLGSSPTRPSRDHSQAKTGAKITMATAFTDWNQLAGMVQPSTSRSDWRSAKTVSEAPACSKAAQKKITKKLRMKITATRCQSSVVRVCFSIPASLPPSRSAGDRPRGRWCR